MENVKIVSVFISLNPNGIRSNIELNKTFIAFLKSRGFDDSLIDEYINQQKEFFCKLKDSILNLDKE